VARYRVFGEGSGHTGDGDREIVSGGRRERCMAEIEKISDGVKAVRRVTAGTAKRRRAG
jgi:hypothetical protein